MRTIEVDDDTYEFLRNCNHLLKNQDNRCTRNPIYTIWHEVKEYGLSEDYSSEYVYIWDDDEFESLEDVFNFMDENGYEEELVQAFNYGHADYSEKYYEENRDEIKAWFVDEDNSYEVTDALSEITQNTFYRVGIRKKEERVVNGTCFSFFEQDAKDHLNLNGHNIKGRRYTYADSLFRSPRMEKLLEVLHNLEFKD